ncbi:TetR/AcrR family transcriptional regulator [Amycolatopsis jejuensis]|uniref:TetR/AcrR family transcriptional regulator n=1 Tax=Amycolatopsis jejuensis TaxID=330084 RepID=UPI0009FCF434|nr:TetR/AcrR family transcriptional regulator [Amycolatopsis jejuensis]
MERRQEASGARDKKRAAIVAAAEEVFVERGFANATMDLVATTANVSKATVYAKFSSKDELLAEIVASMAGRISQEIDRHTDPEEDPRTRLTALACRYALVLFEPHTVALLRLVVAESHHRPEIGKRYLEAGPLPAIAHLASALQELVDRGDLAIKDVDHAALQLVGMVQARRLYSLLDPSLLPSPEDITASATADVEVFLAAYGTGIR